MAAALTLLTAVGGLFRLAGLSRLSLMMDSMWIYFIVQKGTPAWDIMRHWLQVDGAPGQIPFPIAFAAGVLQTLNLPLTLPNLILPFAFWGTLTIPSAYLLGQEMGGRKMGLCLASLVAFNPILIQMSREPYFYASALCGAFLLTWATLRAARGFQQHGWMSYGFHAVNAVAIFLTTYSSPSTWSFAALCATIQFVAMFLTAIRTGRGVPHIAFLVSTCLVLGVPLLLVDWGLRSILDFTGGQAKDYWLKVFRGSTGAQLSQLLDVARQVLWGKTMLRSAFAALLIAAGVYAAWRPRPKQWLWRIALAIILAIAGVNFVALKKSVWGVSIRYLSVVVPLYLLIVGAGLLWCVDVTSRAITRWGSRQGAVIPYLWLLLPLAFWLPPAYAVTQTIGQAFPYRSVVEHLDRLLPRNTPVLTDRFFTAYNEFRVHAPTNVVFVSIGPNQIREEYLGTRFRENAEAFLRANPVSALYEEKHLWKDPEVGPWLWPQTFYANERTFTDHVGLWLTEIGLSLRGAGYNTIRYNLPRDVVARTIREKKPAVALFGDNWSVATTTDNRIWRCLGDKATIDVYNVTASNLVASVLLHGVAIGNTKTVRFQGASTSIFPSNMLVTCNAGTFRLPPGRTTLVVEDLDWGPRRTILVADAVAAAQAMETAP